MIKRNLNLCIKLILVVLLIVLFIIMACIVNSAEQPVEAKATEANSIELKSEPIICCDADCCPSFKEDEYAAKIKKWEEEHYYATKVWEYFRQRGFSQEVTCAIIGNMMIETSGGSLNLNPTIYSPSGNYYGLCQWSLKYCQDAKDLPFEHQLDYLLGTMQCEFNTFGWLYADDFDYESFLKMTDVSEAALAFAKSYERCSSVSYEMRKEAALKAYKYFDLEAPLS